jgi:hypothetical protein
MNKTDFLSELPPINYTPWVGDDCEHDDLMDADAYDRRRAMRDGWISDTEGRY